MKALAWQQCEVLVPASSEPPRSALKLEAQRLAASASGSTAVIAPPHPLYGGTMQNPVVIAIAEGLERAGVAALAFNWRGIDGSEGSRTDSLEAAVADYLAAIEIIASAANGAPLYAAGYSFGAAVALLAAIEDPRISGVIMLAPPSGMLRAEDLTAASARVSLMVGDDDEFAPVADLQAKLGGRNESSFETIPGADHFFHYGGMPEIPGRVAATVERWLKG